MKRLFLKAAGVAVAGPLLKACGGGGGDSPTATAPAPAPAPTTGPPLPAVTVTLLQLVEQDSRFSLLLGAAQKAGLTGQLGDANANLTLFAPPNDAFDAAAARIGLGDGAAMLNALSAGQLASILGFHLVPRRLSLAELQSFGNPGGERPATLYSFRGNPAQLIFITENGQLNIWDGVGRTSITMTQTDLSATNGVIQVVSDVLLPRGVLTVSQMLRANTDYFTHYSGAMTPQLIDELNGAGPFTVFVPQDTFVTPAFDQLTAARRELTLRYHVATRTELQSADFPASVTLQTLASPQTFLLRTSAGQTRLTDSTATAANVIDVDFYASNGVIQVLDKVLVPR
jgi:uncharacterized surface protein with fasciclin (FAS1) repeats